MYTKNLLSLISTFLLVTMCISGGVLAQSSKRAETWEFTLSPLYQESTTIKFEGGPSADIDGNSGFGFGFGYNLNSRFALRSDLSWTSPKYTATRYLEDGSSETFRTRLDLSTISFGADYYFSENKLAPYVNASFGWTHSDSNIADGPPYTSCWWDPWWGYVCNTYQSTKSKTEFSYGAAIGLRYDLSRSLFMRASVGEHYIDYSKAVGSANFVVSRIDIGFSY